MLSCEFEISVEMQAVTCSRNLYSCNVPAIHANSTPSLLFHSRKEGESPTWISIEKQNLGCELHSIPQQHHCPIFCPVLPSTQVGAVLPKPTIRLLLSACICLFRPNPPRHSTYFLASSPPY